MRFTRAIRRPFFELSSCYICGQHRSYTGASSPLRDPKAHEDLPAGTKRQHASIKRARIYSQFERRKTR